MTFLIKQIHTPETCPHNKGGLKNLYNPEVKGVKLKAIYGNFARHITYYVVESDDIDEVDEFLEPGWLLCTSEVIPVAEVEVDK